MKYNDVFPSEYLKSDDVVGAGEEHQISHVEMEQFTDPKTKEVDTKPVLHFKDIEKKLILNKTNWKSLALCHGPDSDQWKGKRVVLRLVEVSAFDKTVDAIRIDEKASV